MQKSIPQDFVSSITHSIITNLKTTSVVNPLLICVAVITLPCLMLLPWASGWQAATLVVFAGLPLAAFLGSYAFFAKNAPDYLRSEDYQFKRHAVQELGDKYRKLSSFERDIIAITPPAATGSSAVAALPPPDPQKADQPGEKQ